MKSGLIRFLAPVAILLASLQSSRAAFDLEAWKTQYGTALTPSAFYASRPAPWHDYFNSNSTDCANNTFLYLGPLGIKARPFDQALSTATFAALYPPVLVDTTGLIQNSFGVMDAPAGSPADGKVYPGDVIIEMEDQRIKTATDVNFPFPVQSQSTRGLEIHAGQLVDAAEGRGSIKLKLIRAALTAYTSPLLTAPTTTSEVTVNVSGQNFVRLTTVSPNNCLANWISARLENGSGGVLYLNAQTVSQQCGFASPRMGQDATGATVYDGAAAITNCIGTRANSMIEFAVPAGYTTFKFKAQTTGSGSSTFSVKTRKSSITTTQPNPRQYDGNGAPVLAPELAPYLETIEFSIPQIGSFGSSYDPNSEKVANYAAILAERLAREQNADGSWPSGGGDYADASFRTAMAGLGLLSTGNAAYNTQLQKAANFCANINPSGWAYPRGIRLMFIAEYYLRTRDAAILPGLQRAVNDAEWVITGDFTCGHGLNMGYGGAGYIGATGTIGTGLAIASKCPVHVDTWKLDNLLERVQELAGGNGGQLPYSRGGIGRDTFSDTPSAGQSYSCGAGGVLATKIRGGPQYITELFRKKFGAATTYGDADGGHASEALTFIMGSLACQIWGDDSHKANMNRFLWRLTLKRDYSGYINLNTNRLEYHGGDAGCHGGPTYDTGGYLVLLNSHRHNLAITGKPEHQATVFPNTPPTYDVDRKLYMRVLSDWNMVDAALGSKMPASLQLKLTELRSIPLGEDLAIRTLDFLQREALAAATLVNGVSGLTSPEKQHYCEMLLGVGHDITIASIDNPVPTTGLSNYRFSLNGYTATTTWDAWGGPALASDPAPSTRMTGSVTLTDPSGVHLSSPVTLNFSPGNLNPTTTFQVPVTQQVSMTAAFNYTVGGSLTISYTRDIIINPSVPFNVDSRAGDYTNVRKVWIPGNCPIPFEKWTMPVQLPSGITLPGASKNEGTIGFHTYDNGTLVTADDVYKARIRGKTAGYWAVSCDRWGECAILGSNLLSGPALTTTSVSGIAANSATSGGNITSDGGWPVTRSGVCWSTSPYPTIYHDKTADGLAGGTFTSTLTGLLPGTVYHVRAYATNAVGTSYGEDITFSTSGVSGTWTTVGGGSWTTTTHWLNGIEASGADGIANFGNVTPASDATVTLDGPRVIGGMIFGNASFTNNWILNAGTGGSLSLDIGISGDPTITVNGGATIINAAIDGTDGLVKAGSGKLVLNASSNFTGITAVNAGTLQLGGSLSAGSPVTVAASGTLAGTGSISANTLVSGMIAPGAAGIGTLTLNKALVLSGTASMEVNKSTASCDRLTGMDVVTYGGTLSVSNLSGTLAAGDKFILFTADAYQGSFSTFNLPALAGSLKWDTSGLMVDGSIMVGTDAAIAGQPSNQAVGQGAGATFTVTATGMPAPAYQWQISTNGGSSWSNINGASATTYSTPPAVSADNNKRFRCVVSNSLATATSNAATLTVTASVLPAFTLQPADVILSAPGAASFTAAATGTPSPTWQWQVSTNYGGAWTNISGATGATYNFIAMAGDDNKAYRCIATNSAGSAPSNSALLLISTVPVWKNRAGGSWPVASNWSNNAVASGTGVTADFSRLNLFASPTVTLDGARTIGHLKFGDATGVNGWTLATGTGGPLTLATPSGTPTITVNNSQALVSCVLGGSNGLAKNGAGNLILSASNTYAGGTTLNAGQLTLNHANALAGGTLTITGGSLGNTSGAPVTIGGAESWNGDFAVNGPDNLTLSGAITLGASRTITVNSPLSVSGAISGAFSLTKAGPGTLVLGTTNSFTGGLTVNAGIVQLKPAEFANALASNSTVTVNSGGTVQVGATNSVGNNINFVVNSGGTLTFQPSHCHVMGLTLNGGAITTTGSGKYASEDFALDANATIGGTSPSTITITNGIGIGTGTRTFTVGDATNSAAADLTLSGAGALRNTGVFAKAGPGTMVITNANVHSGGTNVTAGTLLANNVTGSATGSGAVSISAGATLGGTGIIGGTVNVAGTLAPGSNGIGTLTVNSTVTLTGSTLMEINKAGSASTNDRMSCSGALTCGGSLTVTASGNTLAAGDSFLLFSANTINGTFSALTLPTPPAGLAWDTSRLYVDGSINLGKIPQTITFNPPGTLPYGDALLLEASCTSGLPISFSSSNPNVALLQFGNHVTAVGMGTTTVTASQGGNSIYQAAANVSLSLVVSPATPSVTTVAPSLLSQSSASSGGDNIWDGGAAVTERGVCWSTNLNPTVADSHSTNGSGSSPFSSTLTGLTANTTYYVRAYAKNSAGYGYGGNATLVTPPSIVNGIWIQDADGSWPTPGKWSNLSVPNGIGSTANFATLDITGTRTVTLDSEVTLGALTFGDTSPNSNWILNAGSGGPLILDSIDTTPLITVNNQTTTLGTVIAGSKGLTKAGAGKLILGTTNTFTGGLTVNAGIVQLKQPDYQKSLSDNTTVTVNNGGTVQVGATNGVGNGINFVVNSGGTLTFQPYHCHVMGLTLNGGAITTTGSGKYGSEDFGLDVDATIGGASPSTITIGNGIGIGTGTRTFTVADATNTPAPDLTLSGTGALRNTGAFAKAGPGTMVITNANAHSGGTNVTGGTLLANNTSGSATGSGAVNVATGATLGGTGIISGSVSNNGTLAPGSNGIGNLTINNKLTLAGGSKVAWEISNWTGTAGTGWDKHTVSSLDITATSGSPVTIKPAELSLASFSETNATFLLIQSGSAITGFSADKFSIDTSGLTNPRGTWAVQMSGNNLNLVYTAQTNPDANGNGILDSWEIQKFGNANPGANLPNADPDKDGLSNLIEYALGSDPVATNVSPITYDLVALGDGKYLRITVPKNSSATNLTYVVETCGELHNWSSVDTVIEQSGSPLVVRDNPSTANPPRRFIRLRVVTQP